MRQLLASVIALAALVVAPSRTAHLAFAAVPVGKSTAAGEAEPATQWTVSFLLNVAFAAEYLAAAEMAARDPKTQREFLNDPKASALAERARFALHAAKARSQEIGFAEDLTRALASRARKPNMPLPGPEAVAPTLIDSPLAEHWRTLSAAYEAPAPTCPLDPAEVLEFARYQKRAMDDNRNLTGGELLAKVSGWSDYKTRCLVFVMMGASEGAKRETGFDPLPLMRALRQQANPVLEERALRSLMAARLVEIGEYAESLRLLVELADVEPAFRLPYEVVQRVFGLRQRGEGQVGLRGM